MFFCSVIPLQICETGTEEVARIARQRFDAIFPLLGQPCPRAADAVDKELPEVPLACLHLGNVHDPYLPTVGLTPTTALKTAPAAEHHFLTRSCGVNERGFLDSRVLRTELEWLVEIVSPAAEHYAYGP